MKYLIVILAMLFLNAACGVASLSFAVDYYNNNKTIDCVLSVFGGMIAMGSFIVALVSFDDVVFGSVGK